MKKQAKLFLIIDVSCENQPFEYVKKVLMMISAFVLYNPSTVSNLYQYPSVAAGCTVQFVSDLVRNQEDRFSHDAAHVSIVIIIEPRQEKTKVLHM